MSTRGWYEFYVLDLDNSEMSLAMQFYKWGDATPENAIAEWCFFQNKIEEHQGKFPLNSVNELLQNQLGPLYDNLPKYFAVGTFFFMLQRARENLSGFKSLNYINLAKENRPDYRLGFALGMAKVANRYAISSHPDPYLTEVEDYLAIGYLLREWKNYGLKLNVLQWLQYLTQDTLQRDMGSIASSFHRTDTDWFSYVYRFFIGIHSQDDMKIDNIRLSTCYMNGSDMFAPLQQTNKRQDLGEEYEEERSHLKDLVNKHHVHLYTLDEAQNDFTMISDNFWKLRENPALD